MAGYNPAPPPQDTAELIRYLESELFEIKKAIDILVAGHLDQSHVAPAKPRNGDIRYADGSDWDPGDGQGIYYFNGTSWVTLIDSTM